MQHFSLNRYLANIYSDLKQAQKLVGEISFDTMYPESKKDIFKNDKIQFNQYELETYIRSAIVKVKFVLERLNLINLLQDFNKYIDNYESYHDQFENIPYVDILVNPVIGHIQNYIDAINIQIDPNLAETSKRDIEQIILERILINTPKIITDRELQPKNETEIKNEVYRMLIHVFPDTVREIPISKVSKVYKPDIGIRRLKTAIEYKFADNLKELKRSIGGIFEDIKGYEGSEDWKTFYAVIYQTDHYITHSQLEAEFKCKHSVNPV